MTTCSISFDSFKIPANDRRSEKAADRLGGLIFDTPEFQNYTRLARAVNMDEQVRALRGQIRELSGYFGPSIEDQPAIDALNAQLDALPLMREFRQAENTLHCLIADVNGLISAAAQAPFALYARSGCG